jgi:hypothetical protein
VRLWVQSPGMPKKRGKKGKERKENLLNKVKKGAGHTA